MALNLAKTHQKASQDFKAAFQEAQKAANATRAAETAAGIQIQKIWRGYAARRWFSQLIKSALVIQRFVCTCKVAAIERKRIHRKLAEKRSFLYRKSALNIQRMYTTPNIRWRGHHSRKTHDFHRRKRDAETARLCGEQLRLFLCAQVEARAERDRVLVVGERKKRLEKLAGNLHHLLGTKANPGVYHESVPDAYGYTHPTGNDYNGRRNIPEDMIMRNQTLVGWYKKSIGRNHRAVQLRPIATPPEVKSDRVKASKLAQGPFMVPVD